MRWFKSLKALYKYYVVVVMSQPASPSPLPSPNLQYKLEHQKWAVSPSNWICDFSGLLFRQ